MKKNHLLQIVLATSMVPCIFSLLSMNNNVLAHNNQTSNPTIIASTPLEAIHPQELYEARKKALETIFIKRLTVFNI